MAPEDNVKESYRTGYSFVVKRLVKSPEALDNPTPYPVPRHSDNDTFPHDPGKQTPSPSISQVLKNWTQTSTTYFNEVFDLEICPRCIVSVWCIFGTLEMKKIREESRDSGLGREKF